MDATATNYNSAATTQPANACIYQGCTDQDATNYNAMQMQLQMMELACTK